MMHRTQEGAMMEALRFCQAGAPYTDLATRTVILRNPVWGPWRKKTGSRSPTA